ncbi:DUF2786 domain-containing protein [Streptomyces sp. NPDC001822]|uniref:DUF2786 domain-containing protein n=1 Tax=Streptomyces sp. NPDC001822 TaxID=3364614 RepID=UPI0036CC5D74
MTTPMPEDGKLAKIRAILAKAEDPAATPEEAETYFAKAAALMAKYGIEKAMLADSDPTQDRPGDRVITVKGAYSADRLYLLGYVSTSLNCVSIRKRPVKGVTEVHMFGYESDLDRVELLYTSLLLQMFNGMRQGRPASGESTVTYRKAWMAGFIIRIDQRLREIEAHAKRESPVADTGRSVELVLADRRAVVKARFAAAYPRATDPKGSTRRRGSGLNDGHQAANRADLGQTRVSGRRAISA